MTAADGEDNDAGRRDLAVRRAAARARREAVLVTLLEGLELEQLVQDTGHGGGPSWVAAGTFLVRVVLRWWPSRS